MAGALGSIWAARGRKNVGESVWTLYQLGVLILWPSILRLSIEPGGELEEGTRWDRREDRRLVALVLAMAAV